MIKLYKRDENELDMQRIFALSYIILVESPCLVGPMDYYVQHNIMEKDDEFSNNIIMAG